MYKKHIKGFLDMILATIGVVVLFVPMLLVAVAIRLDSKGPVFFIQLRYGKNRKPFLVYKFRTMRVDAPANKATNSFNDSDIFITPVGKILRKLSIDEIPQILNVLKREMSIIGPRPVVLGERNLIKLREKFNANSIRPGITGWAQVNGRDELNSVQKAEMDGWYVENSSLKTDALCIARTIYVVFSGSSNNEGYEHKQITNESRSEIA